MLRCLARWVFWQELFPAGHFSARSNMSGGSEATSHLIARFTRFHLSAVIGVPSIRGTSQERHCYYGTCADGSAHSLHSIFFREKSKSFCLRHRRQERFANDPVGDPLSLGTRPGFGRFPLRVLVVGRSRQVAFGTRPLRASRVSNAIGDVGGPQPVQVPRPCREHIEGG